MQPPAPDDLPSSIEDAAAIVREARAQATPIRFCGAQSLWAGSVPPPAGARIVSLHGLDQIELDAADLVARVGGGLAIERLRGALARLGLVWPVERLEPGGTVGGLIASGRGSALHPGDAPARRWILGAQVLTGNGELVTVGGATVKNSSGYGLTHAMWGSAGRLGGLVGITLRLRHPTDSDANSGKAFASTGNAVFAAAVQVRCDELPAGFSDQDLARATGAALRLISGDGTRAIIGFDQTDAAEKAVADLASCGCQAAIDYPPSAAAPTQAPTNTMWRVLRSAMDPAGVLV